jgi:DNA-directed RNA polymerase sigma subunit (sigma70/sigma32)
LSAACFVVQSCLADADFVVFSNYCLIGTRQIISLFAQRDKESNGEEVVPDLETDVEEEIIHTITLQKLREVLTALPKEDAALLTALYLQTPPLTLRAYSEQTGIPVMTLHYRKEKLLQLLKKLL